MREFSLLCALLGVASAGYAAEPAAADSVILLGPLRHCEDTEGLAALADCEADNEKAALDARVVEKSEFGGFDEWLPHPDPVKRGWFLHPTGLGRYAFDLAALAEGKYLPDALETIAPEVLDLRSSVFFSNLDRLNGLLSSGKEPEPSPQLADRLAAAARTLAEASSPPPEAGTVGARFALLAGRYEAAEVLASLAVKRSPDKPLPLTLRAAARVRLEKPLDAYADAEVALRLDSRNKAAKAVERAALELAENPKAAPADIRFLLAEAPLPKRKSPRAPSPKAAQAQPKKPLAEAEKSEPVAIAKAEPAQAPPPEADPAPEPKPAPEATPEPLTDSEAKSPTAPEPAGAQLPDLSAIFSQAGRPLAPMKPDTAELPPRQAGRPLAPMKPDGAAPASDNPEVAGIAAASADGGIAAASADGGIAAGPSLAPSARPAPEPKGRRLPIGLWAVWAGAAILAAGAAAGLISFVRRKSPPAPEPEPAFPEGPETPAVLEGITGTEEDSEAPAPVLIAKRWARGRQIGKGTTGEVFAARDGLLARDAVLRKLRPEITKFPEDRAMILAEVRAAAQIVSPRIATVFGAIEEGADLYIAGERVPGKGLNAVLEEGPVFTGDRALSILSCVSEGLAHAHARGIFHRDLAPSHILLMPDGGLKVTGFGVAYAAKRIATARLPNFPWGSEAYRAPELAAGIDSKRLADLYSYAVLAYHLLTGALPFPGPEFQAQKSEGKFPPPSSAGDLPISLNAVFERALKPEPADRIGTVPVFFSRLEAVLKTPA